ncbi:PAS domain S-box protein [Halovenus rubra]|uniref:histidine kinase n=1 Tax=Halovenus rubra TaxID=869890 RepID=A0ABD5X0U2_9EURY
MGITISDPQQDDNPLIYVNEEYVEMTGYTKDEALGRNCRFLQGSDTSEKAVAAMRNAVDSVNSVTVELRNYRKDGSQFWNRVSISPVTTEDGEVTHFAGFQQHITESKQAQLDLERTSRFLKETQEVADVGGWEVDLRSDSLRWTKEVYRIHGVDTDFEPTVEEAIDLYHPEDRATMQDAVEQATTEGEPYDEEVRIVRPDGEVRWTRARGEPRYEDGEIVGVRGTFQDITEQKTRESQLRESNERLEQFAYVASHDLQEPLRTISNYTEILAEDYAEDLDEEAQRFIDVVVTGSERMQSMINGLLDYSRVTTRGGEFEPVETEEVIADTVADLEIMLDEHDGTVETGDLPTVEADGNQLHQVFQNLVKNALEHSGEDPATIEIRGSEEPNQYRFEVEDDGPGIAESRQEKIFRIFKSGEQYQTQSQAKGLGLAICDNIVRRHGGEIWVESELDDGATFVFTISKDKEDAT